MTFREKAKVGELEKQCEFHRFTRERYGMAVRCENEGMVTETEYVAHASQGFIATPLILCEKHFRVGLE